MKREIANTDYVIFIDDFHYIAKEAQAELSRQIKDAIANGCKFICASVPYHSDDVLRGNSDLRGRIFNIDFDYWDESTLKIIAQKGFKLLNIDASDEVISELVKESAGSPQLMQYLCLNSCFEMNVRETSDTSIKYQKILPHCKECANVHFSQQITARLWIKCAKDLKCVVLIENHIYQKMAGKAMFMSFIKSHCF